MFQPVPNKISFPELEKRILHFWQERDIFRQSLRAREGRPAFVFYEGPPTANGSPGIHHVLARVFKDVIPRFQTMRGRYVPRKGGWDTHGLPVEIEVERELGFSGKLEIEAYGVDRFNARCRESVFRYVQEWQAMTDRIGFWIDMEHPYITCENYYIESGWWIIRQLWDRGLLYQDYKVTPHCPRCGTSLSSHEVALGYKDDAEDPSIYVLFPLRKDVQYRGAEGASKLGYDFQNARWTEESPFLLAWTTTPWTLTGNVALAVAPDEPYVLVEAEGPGGVLRRIVLAEALADHVLGGRLIRRITTVQGRDLAGILYEPLYSFLPPDRPTHRVIVGEFVSMTEGTGIVHIAPAFGEVDLELGRAHNLPVLQTVDPRGNFIAEVTPWAGRWVKDADPLIIEDLRQRGLLLRSERITHTYPFCWRCETPLLYYAKTSWYIKTTACKENLLATNDQINWYPGHIKHGRFGDWLQNNVDWAISRERYWGTPLPIWRCEACGELHCVGSVAELRERSSDPRLTPDFDLHRPYIDEITFPCTKGCGGTMRRVPEVLDCWFDSGAMPVAQEHFPFEHEEDARRPRAFPADFICEAVDQTRGWFYSLHALSTLLFDEPCFRNVISLGHILDAKGEKMSKSRGNVVDPWSVLETSGADALRWYLFTASPAGNPRRFSGELVAEVVRRFLLTLWNTYSFFVIYANIDRWRPPVGEGLILSPLHDLDRWVLSELNVLVQEVTDRLEGYDPTGGGRAIQAFVEDLSNWYVRRSRRRFWKSENDQDKAAAYATLYHCLVTLAKLLAPFTPFLAEELYQNLVRSVDPAAPESVHLTDWPMADVAQVDQRLREETRLVMKVASLGRAARSKAGLKVRQPLATILVRPRSPSEGEALLRLAPQILDELNIKELRLTEGGEELLEYTIKPNLAALGPKYGRELSRIAAALSSLEPRAVASAVSRGQNVSLDGYILEPEEVLVEAHPKPGWAVAEEADPPAGRQGWLVAVSTELSPDLLAEGLARELVHRLQSMRKEAGFDIADKITTYYQGSDHLAETLERFADYLQQETLSLALVRGTPPEGAYQAEYQIEGERVLLGVKKA
jgi:isoleucyl-tRNA synthetase